MQKQRKPKSQRKSRDNRRDSWEDRESRDMKRDDRRKTTSSNDPRWYATDPALLRDSASIPFSWPIGQEFSNGVVNSPDGTAYPDSIKTSVIPGVCAIELVPTFGSGLDSDALNIAASSMYSFVRHTNAGHANYDPNDLMIYVLGMTQVYSYINFLERCYALATLYEQRNRYLPDTLFQAQGIDGDSIKNNLADFRYRINVMINNVSALAVPATMTLFLRQAMIYSYIYAEGESVKDQLYMYYPNGFYSFTLDGDSAGMLQYVKLNPDGELLTWEDLITYGDNMYQAIWDQEDFGIMSGDILKSYGQNILSLSSLSEVVPFAPVYDPMVLHQIKNATIVSHYAFDFNQLGVYQNANKSKLITTVNSGALTNPNHINIAYLTAAINKVLSIDAPEVNPDLVIESTRLMVALDTVVISEGTTTVVFACGSEIPIGCHYWSLDSAGVPTAVGESTHVWLSNNNYPSIKAAFTLSALMKNFKYSPDLWVVTSEGTSQAILDAVPYREVDNYAVLSSDDIKKMHTSAVLNMLNVPSAAKNPRV